VVWDCYVGVVAVVVAIMSDVGDIINADGAGDAGVLAAVMDVTTRNDRAWASQVPKLCENRGVTRVGTNYARACAHVGERLADAAGPTFKEDGRAPSF
jgi:hypothetical protein